MSRFSNIPRISTVNSSTTNLAVGNSYTFTGTWELSYTESVMVNLYADQVCELTMQFSMDGGTTVHSSLTKMTTVGFNEFTTAVKGARYFRVVVTTNSLTTTDFDLQTQYGTFRQGNAPGNLSVSLDADASLVRPTSFQDEVVIGRRSGVTPWAKWGYNTDVDTGSEEIIASFGGTFTPLTSAETFNIAYDGTAGGSTDGAGTTGATELTFYYIDSNGLPAVSTHTLGTDGSDTTSFSGLGINRVAVSASGTNDTNVSTITITATTAGTNQAEIPSGDGVTQQAIFFVGSNHTAVAKNLLLNIVKIGVGTEPTVIIRGWVYNRGIDCKFEIFRHTVDTAVENTVPIPEPVGFKLNSTDVLYFTAETDTNNTQVSIRFSLNEYQKT